MDGEVGRQGADLLGAHMSIAGGVEKAPGRGREVGCRAIQIFTGNNARWKAKPIGQERADLFRARLEQAKISSCLAHAGYLINLCAPDGRILRRSIRALLDEVGRCGRLGIGGLVVHAGCHGGAGERFAIRRAARSLDEVTGQAASLGVKILLENSAGQGTSIGYRFAQLAAIRDLVRDPDSIAFCFDTCHAFAAGYDLREAGGYEATLAEWDALLGMDSIAAVHLNDCKLPLGSHRDRHEHIGLGTIGLSAFWRLVNDPRLARVPKILETPKQGDGFADRENLKVLRRLLGRQTPPTRRPAWRRANR